MLKIDRGEAQKEMMHLVRKLRKPIKDLSSMARFAREFCQGISLDEQFSSPYNPDLMIRELFKTQKDTTRASIREVFKDLLQSQQASVLKALSVHAMIEI